MNRRIRSFDANTGSYGRVISDDDETRYVDPDTLGSGSFRNDGNDDPRHPAYWYRDRQAEEAANREPLKRELPAPTRRPSPSLYDALRGRDDTLDLTEQELLDLVSERARTHAQGSPERAAALNRVAARIAQHQADWVKLSHRDQLDAWDQLLTHETEAPRRRDGAIDPADMEAQSLAAAGRGSLDLSAHPETRLRGRDLRAEYEQEQSEKSTKRGNQ